VVDVLTSFFHPHPIQKPAVDVLTSFSYPHPIPNTFIVIISIIVSSLLSDFRSQEPEVDVLTSFLRLESSARLYYPPLLLRSNSSSLSSSRGKHHCVPSFKIFFHCEYLTSHFLTEPSYDIFPPWFFFSRGDA
jgi:hypothetical protein